MPKVDIRKEPLQRDMVIDNSTVNEDDRTIEVAFSSEFAGERWYGVEILDHSPSSVRLDRLNSGGAVLADHDIAHQVGVVESARIDSDRVGRAVLKFSRSVKGQEFFDDVKDGIRKNVSVRYKIDKYEYEEGKDGAADTYRVTDWTPLEVSIVSIPFDPTVGVGRSIADDTTNKIEQSEVKIMPKENIEETRKEEAAPVAKTFDESNLRASAQKEERDRINQIRQMGEMHDLDDMSRSAIADGWSYDKFSHEALSVVGERNNKAKIDTRHDGKVDLESKDLKEYSFVRLMAALSNPNDRALQKRAAFELEVSDAATKGFGSDFSVRGAYIPEAILSRALSTGGGTASLTSTDLSAGSFVDVMRNNMAAARAGMRTLSGLVGNVDIPRQLSGSTMSWLSAEDSDASESEPSFDQFTLSPKDAACYTEVTRRSLQQSTPSIDSLIQGDLAMAIALGLDKAAFYGTGLAGQPTGIKAASGVNLKAFTSPSAPSYDEMINMVKTVMAQNALVGNPKFVFGADGWAHLSTTSKQASGSEGNFIMPETTIKGYEGIMSTQIDAGDYFFGNFSDLLMGEWGGLELNVDPYTHSLKGRVRYIIFKTVDLALRNPKSFVVGS